MGEAITSEDLALELGISRATVSIVLRGDAKWRKISPITVQRVLDAARRHNYVPNQAARLLRRRRSRTDMIGLIFPDFRFDWADRVMSGMLEALAHNRCTPFVSTHRFDENLFRKEVTSALQRRDDALICHPLPGMRDLYEQMGVGPMPVVLLGDRPPDVPEAANLSSVMWNSAPATATAVNHLLEIGRRRIGMVAIDYPMEMGRSRVHTFHSTLAAAGLTAHPDWVAMGPPVGPADEVVENMLDRMFGGKNPHPDGLFVFHDGLALMVLDGLRRRRLSVPEDVAVIGLGDLPWSGNAVVGLSTVTEPIELVGREAISVAMRLIQNPKSAPVHCTVDGAQLQVRQSTIGDRWVPSVREIRPSRDA
jgi:DNA-binding LacI/PurR family transcriptional regulator